VEAFGGAGERRNGGGDGEKKNCRVEVEGPKHSLTDIGGGYWRPGALGEKEGKRGGKKSGGGKKKVKGR